VTVWGQFLLWLRYRLSGGLKEVEDPRRALDLAYTRQLELLARVRQGVADVVTARKRLELQARQLSPSADRLEEQARAAVAEHRQDLARAALGQRNVLRSEVEELARQTADLAAQETGLVEAAREVELQVQQLRIRRESLSAAYAAARAREQVSEAMAARRLDGADLNAIVGRAEAAVAETRARAQAVEGLLARAALGPGQPAPAALPPTSSDVDSDLARIEEEVLWGRRLASEEPAEQ
jgi:phage shock protein A